MQISFQTHHIPPWIRLSHKVLPCFQGCDGRPFAWTISSNHWCLGSTSFHPKGHPWPPPHTHTHQWPMCWGPGHCSDLPQSTLGYLKFQGARSGVDICWALRIPNSRCFAVSMSNHYHPFDDIKFEWSWISSIWCDFLKKGKYHHMNISVEKHMRVMVSRVVLRFQKLYSDQQAHRYEACPGSIWPSTWIIETFIEEDTRNTVHKTVMPQSPSK